MAVVPLTGEAGSPRLELVAVNEAGGPCMASVALAGGKLFLRTDKALLCIGGVAKPGDGEPAAELPAAFAELKKLYEEHPATDGPDAALRIAIVERMASMPDAESMALLQKAALKDPQWDVGEAAAKSLAAIAPPAVLAMIALMGAVDWQPYLNTIAADALGQLGAVEAVDRPTRRRGGATGSRTRRELAAQAGGWIGTTLALPVWTQARRARPWGRVSERAGFEAIPTPSAGVQAV